MIIATVNDVFTAGPAEVAEQFMALDIPWSGLSDNLLSVPSINIIWLQGTVMKTEPDPGWIYSAGILWHVNSLAAVPVTGLLPGQQPIVLHSGNPYMPAPFNVPIRQNAGSAVFIRLACTFGEKPIVLLDEVSFRITIGYEVPEVGTAESGGPILDPIKVFAEEISRNKLKGAALRDFKG